MFITARIEPAPEVGRGLFESGGSPIRNVQPPDVRRIVRRRVGYLDTSGKSPAYHHHRKNFKARAGKLAAGFLNRTAAAFFGACHSSHVGSSSQDASRRAAVRTFRIGMICSEDRFPLFRIMVARTRERAGTRRGKDPRPPAAPASEDPACGSRLKG
jgi:hypothetical protein